MHKFSVGQRVKVKADHKPVDGHEGTLRFVGCVCEIVGLRDGNYVAQYQGDTIKPHLILVPEDGVELAADDDNGGRPRLLHKMTLTLQEKETDEVEVDFKIDTDPATAEGVGQIEISTTNAVMQMGIRYALKLVEMLQQYTDSAIAARDAKDNAGNN